MYWAAPSHNKVLPECTHKEGKSILFSRLNLKNVSFPRSLGPEVHCQAQHHPAILTSRIWKIKNLSLILGRRDGRDEELTVRCWLHEPGWPAGPFARLTRFSVLEVTVILVLHEEMSCLQRDWKQCACTCTCALCYPLSCCWFGSPGWPGERDYMENFQPS